MLLVVVVMVMVVHGGYRTLSNGCGDIGAVLGGVRNGKKNKKTIVEEMNVIIKRIRIIIAVGANVTEVLNTTL